MNVKCSLCLGSGKFEGYLCYRCGGVGEYLWIEELFGVDPKKKYSFIRIMFWEEHRNIYNRVLKDPSLSYHDLYENILLKFKEEKIIFDCGASSHRWVQLNPKDRAYSLDFDIYLNVHR